MYMRVTWPLQRAILGWKYSDVTSNTPMAAGTSTVVSLSFTSFFPLVKMY